MRKSTPRSRRIASITLAAGRGRRMGQPKALLRWNDRSFIEHHTLCHLALDISPIIIVTSAELIDQLKPTLSPSLTWITGDPQTDPLSSLMAGLQALNQHPSHAVLVGPIDQGPYPDTLLLPLLQDFEPTSSEIRIPTFQGTPGHPVLLGAAFRNNIAPHPHGLRGLIQEHQNTRMIPVESASTLRNLNTREQFERFLAHPAPLNEPFFEDLSPLL